LAGAENLLQTRNSATVRRKCASVGVDVQVGSYADAAHGQQAFTKHCR
jgi:hypothetical protein